MIFYEPIFLGSQHMIILRKSHVDWMLKPCWLGVAVLRPVPTSWHLSLCPMFHSSFVAAGKAKSKLGRLGSLYIFMDQGKSQSWKQERTKEVTDVNHYLLRYCLSIEVYGKGNIALGSSPQYSAHICGLEQIKWHI